MSHTHAIAALALLAGSLACHATPLTERDLEAAQTSFAIEAALEGCWLRIEKVVPCGDRASIGAKCTSIEVKKVPCEGEEKRPAASEKKGGDA